MASLTTYDSFAAANAAKAEGQSVSGTYVKDQPVYFLVSADTSEDEMRRLAFEVRNGRPMSGYETTILELAESGVR